MFPDLLILWAARGLIGLLPKIIGGGVCLKSEKIRKFRYFSTGWFHFLVICRTWLIDIIERISFSYVVSSSSESSKVVFPPRNPSKIETAAALGFSIDGCNRWSFPKIDGCNLVFPKVFPKNRWVQLHPLHPSKAAAATKDYTKTITKDNIRLEVSLRLLGVIFFLTFLKITYRINSNCQITVSW